MSVRTRKQQGRRRSPAEDEALWRRFRGQLGAEIKPLANAGLKSSSDALPDFDWSAFRPADPVDPLRAGALSEGIWRAGLERYELDGDELPWEIEGASLHFRDRVHRFDWLPALVDSGESGLSRAEFLLDSWIEAHGRFDGFAWRPGPTADRVWNWMRCGMALLQPASETIARLRLTALRRQSEHLEALSDACSDVTARLRIFCILAVQAALGRETGRLEAALDRLDAECTAQILPDGGHVTRSPERLLIAMLDLAAVEDTLNATGMGGGAFLAKWLPRMGAMLNFFRAGDGALHPFNDSSESSPDRVAAALDRLETPPRRFMFSPKSGFQKLERGDLSVIVDVGAAPAQPFGDQAHAGALGFEMSDGEARIITNCGFSQEVDVDWQAAVRRTGAHSTLVLGGRDSAPFLTNDATSLLSPEGPDGISAKRLEEADEVWLEAQHSGYKDTLGLMHLRRLFLAGDGTRLTGEDSLVRPISRGEAEDDRPISFEIRFHLHPTLTALMGREDIALVSESGARWRFKTSHAGTRLEKSIYLARGTVEPAEQIVITGRADPNGDGSTPPNCVRWAFLKDGK